MVKLKSQKIRIDSFIYFANQALSRHSKRLITIITVLLIINNKHTHQCQNHNQKKLNKTFN